MKKEEEGVRGKGGERMIERKMRGEGSRRDGGEEDRERGGGSGEEKGRRGEGRGGGQEGWWGRGGCRVL